MDRRPEFLMYLTATQERKRSYVAEGGDPNALWADYAALRGFEREFSGSEPFFSRAAREQAEDLRRLLSEEKRPFRHPRNPL